MRCHVYSRVERVIYVVGVVGKKNQLAEALDPSSIERLRGDTKEKPFRDFRDKRVMYIERIGIAPIHLNDRYRQELGRANKRAEFLNLEYSDLDIEP